MIELAKEIGEALVIIIIAVSSAIKYMKAQSKKEHNKNKTEVSSHVENTVQTEADIIQYMEYIKEESFADRVLMFEFHNGGHYADGRLATKMSCTFEVCRHSIRPIQSSAREIQLSRVSKTLKKLFDNNIIVSSDIEELREIDFETYHLLRNTGVKQFYMKLIRNREENPIGFLILEYCSATAQIIPNIEPINEYFGVIKNKLFDLIYKK